MSEADVTRQISSQFELRDHWEAGPSSVWRVCEKHAAAELPCAGTVAFEKGKLFEATRTWRQDGSPADLARFFNTVVARFIEEGNSSCRLDVVRLRDRLSTDESSLVICGHKQIRMGFITPEPNAMPYVVEVLSEATSS
jgi:hypothetical protein